MDTTRGEKMIESIEWLSVNHTEPWKLPGNQEIKNRYKVHRSKRGGGREIYIKNCKEKYKLIVWALEQLFSEPIISADTFE